MILRLYAAATALAAPFLTRMLTKRAGRGKEIPARLAERRGIASLERPAGRLVWVHAASVGETMSALPLLRLLAARGPVLLTTGTVTSAKLAAERLPPGALHQFVPLDVPGWAARFLEHWRPDVAVFLESEIWPNLLTGCDARGIRRVLVNGRISAGSARNWARVPRLARRLLGGFSAIHAQSAGDAALFRGLGAANLREWGNLKFFAAPLPVDDAALARLQAACPGPVWLAASTHPGEEEEIYAAHQALLAEYPDLITLLVPRHPERGGAVAALCGNAPRRSLGEMPVAGRVYVADTLGELGLFFRAAPFALVGNSLVGFGGHNIVEPALLARPVICGPHLENFIEAAERLRGAQALLDVVDVPSLIAAVRGWLADPEAAHAAGARAQAVFAGSERLPERLVGLILGREP